MSMPWKALSTASDRIFSTFSRLIDGHTISDAIATLGGLNVIAGELER